MSGFKTWNNRNNTSGSGSGGSGGGTTGGSSGRQQWTETPTTLSTEKNVLSQKDMFCMFMTCTTTMPTAVLHVPASLSQALEEDLAKLQGTHRPAGEMSSSEDT